MLKGFSIREQQRLPLRWFAEEVPPKPLFREDEIADRSHRHLAEALQQLGANERAHFEVRGPGNNPRYRRDVVAGWVAVRDPYLYLTVEYFHNQIPIRKSDNYDYNYPTPASDAEKLHPLFRAGPLLGHGRQGHPSRRVSTIPQIWENPAERPTLNSASTSAPWSCRIIN